MNDKRWTFAAVRNPFSEEISALWRSVKLIVLGCLVGGIVGAGGSLFAHALLLASAWRAAHPALLFALPLAGLLIVFLYHAAQNQHDKGTNTVIAAVHSSVRVPFRMAPLIFVSTFLTHLFGGSAGREGAALQLGAGIAGKLGSILRLNENDKRLMIMSGMSAGFSALFGTPLAAAVFAMEVVSVGIMHYSALVPCVTAALVANFVGKALRVPPEVFPVESAAMTLTDLPKVILLAAAAAWASVLFCVLLHRTAQLYRKYLKNPYLRIAAAGVLVAVFTVLLGTDDYLGSGMSIIERVFHHGAPIAPYAFLLKMIFTALTLGGGFRGGEIVPSLAIGAALGSCLAGVVGLPVELAAACGMIGVFCGATNTPLTALLLSFELFGFSGMPFYLLTVAVSYLLSGRYGLYSAQRIMYSKTETKYINSTAK